MRSVTRMRLEGCAAVSTGRLRFYVATAMHGRVSTLGRVVDRAVQVLGGSGVTGESAVMRIFTDMRAFRIYDGPSEVHRWSMARKIVHTAQKNQAQA